MNDLEKEIEEHMETYAHKFEEWNSKTPYKPSFLFSWREKCFGWLHKLLQKYMPNNLYYEEDVLKYLVTCAGLALAFFVAAIFLIL